MSSSAVSLLPMFLSQLLSQLPVIVVCIVGLALLAGRRSADAKAITWAMTGFGLTAALAISIPLLYATLSFVQVQGSLSLSSMTWVYPVIAFTSSALHALAYLLFLLAFLRFVRPAVPRTP
ncbi:MAG: hypothetical protein QM691_10360 [Opitutaceae bacterium]